MDSNPPPPFNSPEKFVGIFDKIKSGLMVLGPKKASEAIEFIMDPDPCPSSFVKACGSG